MAWIYLILGVLMLLFGGDFIVKGAVDIALRFKISTLVVGMTVVSFATSAPELLVSLDAALKGYSDISFGNVIGSNIANIALILGLTAVIVPLSVQAKTYKFDWWIMMLASLLLYALIFFDHILSKPEAAILVVALVLYNVFIIRSSRKKDTLVEDIEPTTLKKPILVVIFLVLGVLGLKFGAQFLIQGAVALAEGFGVSERIIAITIVSVGTSLPELAASLVAAFKKEPDLSVGNLIGSNVFNILAVLGFTGLVIDIPVNNTSLLSVDFPWLIGISILLYLLIRFITQGKINRWGGLLMFLVYLGYIAVVIL